TAESAEPADIDADGNGAGYAERLGERLRNVRQQQGYSLHDVEVASDGELKASVVGAYERGERAVSVARLRRLATFYKVPIAQLLPGPESRRSQNTTGAGIRIDLTRLDRVGGTDVEILERYLSTIQARRGDYNGRVMTVRASDLTAIAAVLDRGPEELRRELVISGIATETGD
ncbi:MAG: transcriptional regulator, partial [Nitriliruptorales bacterium]|nr:transcriptional regulator [Nitriliruptorales bacterium]